MSVNVCNSIDDIFREKIIRVYLFLLRYENEVVPVVVTIAQLPGNIPAFDHKGLIHEKKKNQVLPEYD